MTKENNKIQRFIWEFFDNIDVQVYKSQSEIRRKIKRYQELYLMSAEVQFLKDLEQLLGEPIPKIDQGRAEFSEFGFVVENYSIIKLFICGKMIKSLPATLGNLKNLRKLDLYENDLESLPDSIGQLKELKILNLACNYLTSLPESLGKLQNLQNLVISDNPLLSLPESFPNLSNLQHLYFDWNPLSADLSLYRMMNNDIFKALVQASEHDHWFYDFYNHPLWLECIGIEKITHVLGMIDPSREDLDRFSDRLNELANLVKGFIKTLKSLDIMCPFCGYSKLLKGYDRQKDLEHVVCLFCETYFPLVFGVPCPFCGGLKSVTGQAKNKNWIRNSSGSTSVRIPGSTNLESFFRKNFDKKAIDTIFCISCGNHIK